MKKELKVRLAKVEPFDSGIVISKNCTRGAQIQTAEEVHEVALSGGSLYDKDWGVTSASFVISMQFIRVMDAVRYGKLFRVIKHEPAKREFPKLNKSIMKPIEGEQKNV